MYTYIQHIAHNIILFFHFIYVFILFILYSYILHFLFGQQTVRFMSLLHSVPLLGQANFIIKCYHAYLLIALVSASFCLRFIT